ncbi:AroM family protein [Achromobacter sp. HZ01]|jgi:protein AroM|uniref:AroM family protein n=1 Tax=Achromobacter pulmonis TaxID=1389932 RepID=A0A2N8KKU0_9BURK|nr:MULTISPECIES: AroM family protein [Achromobacter]MBO9329224.1 AroM family protein [Achromobacter xylosoxidans]PND34056.1 AroM family protein [Achromobacter pulmonis]RAP64842.1 AroM family protein [Achromobacter sp. HZ01]
MSAQPRRRVAFFTIGQSPRSDVVPEIAPLLGAHVQVDEFGALDGLDAAALAALAPKPGAYRFATRMRDGSQIELDAAAAEARLAQVMSQADAAGYDVLVPLCTGTAIAPMRTLVVEPQQVVDHLVAALAQHCRKVGLVVPLAAQVDAFHMAVPLPCDVQVAHASPYEADAQQAARNFEQAGRELASCDLIVMHCMGYAERMRAAVAQASGRPVLLSNRLVAQTLAQILGPGV